MAKRKSQLVSQKYRKKLLTAAGIFAAGSVVGSALEIPPMSAYFEITTPDSVKITETDSLSPVPPETYQTVSVETEAPYVPPETAAQVTQTPVNPTPVAPVPPTPPPQEAEPEPVPEPSVPAVTPTPVPEPEQDSDWMTGIFIPAEPFPVEKEESDWMEPSPTPSPVPEPSVTAPASPATSSMTEELAAMLETVAVFWSNADNKIHLEPACPGAPVLFAGTLEEAQTVRTAGWCRRCAEHLDGTDKTAFYIKGNPYASFDAVASSYTYSDYLNGIPADAFGG